MIDGPQQRGVKNSLMNGCKRPNVLPEKNKTKHNRMKGQSVKPGQLRLTECVAGPNGGGAIVTL